MKQILTITAGMLFFGAYGAQNVEYKSDSIVVDQGKNNPNGRYITVRYTKDKGIKASFSDSLSSDSQELHCFWKIENKTQACFNFYPMLSIDSPVFNGRATHIMYQLKDAIELFEQHFIKK